MIQDGKCVNLGDPLSSLNARYIRTSQKRQELMDDLMEVGLIDSTRRMGKPFTWQLMLYELWRSRGSDQWKCNSLRDKGRKCNNM